MRLFSLIVLSIVLYACGDSGSDEHDSPGGRVGIVDHYAEAGASTDSGTTVHRIDPAIVIADMRAAGFELEARSDLLRNPDDDYSRIVFDPELRGKTDRFVLRFTKDGTRR